MKKASYVLVDVFAKKPFGGNPLAVFPDEENLSSREMQLLAKEMNLSETAFVLPPTKGSGADFRVRIFVPDTEVRYAGRPTLGTFYVLAQEGRIKLKEPVTTVSWPAKRPEFDKGHGEWIKLKPAWQRTIQEVIGDGSIRHLSGFALSHGSAGRDSSSSGRREPVDCL